ncbi:uncharacterized protein METZ01_LOCUS142714 [marine metagenome]|uniref:Uncharacterized protein n=1 Tax=marine metagenome TaxID=408172 RepID=A0A381ZKT7_9ZZZZ
MINNTNERSPTYINSWSYICPDTHKRSVSAEKRYTEIEETYETPTGRYETTEEPGKNR